MAFFYLGIGCPTDQGVVGTGPRIEESRRELTGSVGTTEEAWLLFWLLARTLPAIAQGQKEAQS